MSRALIRRSGAVLIPLILTLACWPYGFAGGGLPSHIRTVAILPFDNETTSPDLTGEISETLRREFQSRLGLREAAEVRANAIVRGSIVRYEIDIPVSFSADPSQATTARRKLQLTVSVEIVDQQSGRTLIERRNLSVEGEYAESAEAAGRRQAVDKLVDRIIDDVQSQW
jgi:hypothetical protein